MSYQEITFTILPFAMVSAGSKIEECVLPMTLFQANAALLIEHLTSTVRANTVNIIPPDNAYLFGRENGSTATYTCQWIQNQIVITHTNVDAFDMELKFYRISQA